ncbi:MAG: AAA family ATPase [Actinophytocola sp.]|uniref:AAA family ATPase n=1 Tax=Actinophytocola sp. TaxID=1872138 RepID=UPI003C7249B9
MICAGCGRWTDEPRVETDGAGTVLVCVACGHREPYRRLPLFAVTGPSGTGKSTVGRVLAARLADTCVVAEQDLLWVGALRDPTGDSAAFRQTWLRLAASLQQSGRPVVLCGTVAPPQFETWPERVLFDDIHYLALVCDADVLRARLMARPAWRGWDAGRIDEMIEFAEWMRTARTEPMMTRLDTTTRPVSETAADVEAWVRSRLGTRDDRQLHAEGVAEHG